MQSAAINRSVAAAASRKKSPARGADGLAFARQLAGDDLPQTGDVPLAAPMTLPGMLEAQEIGLDGGRGRRALAVRQGSALLDRLEGLRSDILDGAVSPQRLRALARAVRDQRSRSDEAGLDAVLAEIELRAEVELAKLTRVGENLAQTPPNLWVEADLADNFNELPTP